MKRIITPFLALSMLFASVDKLCSQTTCSTGGTFTTSSTYNFASNAQDFSGDFSWVNQASGQLQSTPLSAGTTKVLTTTTFFQPLSNPTIGFSFDLGGTANVSAYTVDALYYNGSSIVPVAVCTGGGALSTSGGSVSFALPAPSVIKGTNFRLRITFTATGSPATKTLLVDNFNSNVGSANAPLPVTFAYFGEAAATGGVKLTWAVATESNVNRYDIERSTNGSAFTKIGSVSASGATTYSFLDASYQAGSNYYRLKSIDNDGQYKYSTIVVFKVDKNTLTSVLKTYPVPATSDVTVFHDPASATSSISIVSTDGRILKTIIPVTGANETQINISSLKPGLYMIRYSIKDSGAVTTRLVKQ